MTTPVYQQPQGGYGYPPHQTSQNPFPPPQQGYGPPQPQADMEYGIQPQGGYGYPPPQASYVSQNPFPPPQQAYEPSQPQADQWISAPTVPINCPPGLEYLTAIDQLLVQQKVEIFEDTDCCTRYCCGPIRPFDMKILDNTQREVIHLYRPLKCQSCCFPCCLQRLEVMSPPGQVIGYVKQEWSLCSPKFRIEDASGECVLRIEGPFCIVNCCGDIKFRVLSKDGSTRLGKITKQWSGLLREAYTDADNFGISFPLDLDVNIKAVLLGACFLIDFMFFEKSANK